MSIQSCVEVERKHVSAVYAIVCLCACAYRSVFRRVVGRVIAYEGGNELARVEIVGANPRIHLHTERK